MKDPKYIFVLDYDVKLLKFQLNIYVVFHFNMILTFHKIAKIY